MHLLRRLRNVFLLTALVAALLPAPPAAAAPQPGSLIKRAADPAVYYLGSDNKRYVFPNDKTYFTWYRDFSLVQTIPDAMLASFPIGGNVTYRPGVKLVKIQSDPKTYAVAKGGVLRHVTSEALAAALFGAQWVAQVDDVPDSFFVNYTIGMPITQVFEYQRSTEQALAPTINQDKGLPYVPPPPPTASAPKIGTCQIFPSDNPWNTDISSYPVHPNSSAYMASVGLTSTLHADFGEHDGYGIPYNVVDSGQAKVPIVFTLYGDESDPGPYPIPPDAKVEAGGDGHVLVVDRDACMLYELYEASKMSAGWQAGSGAVFDLKSNALRPDGWTSTDAAGLPVFAGLVRYDEVLAGAINHALRFTAPVTQRAYIHPATHQAGSTSSAAAPPMGLRVRLKKNFDISGYTGAARVILEALKKYGMLLADNGASWYIQGEQAAPWNDNDLNQLKKVPGSAFEAVETGLLIK